MPVPQEIGRDLQTITRQLVDTARNRKTEVVSGVAGGSLPASTILLIDNGPLAIIMAGGFAAVGALFGFNAAAIAKFELRVHKEIQRAKKRRISAP